MGIIKNIIKYHLQLEFSPPMHRIMLHMRYIFLDSVQESRGRCQEGKVSGLMLPWTMLETSQLLFVP